MSWHVLGRYIFALKIAISRVGIWTPSNSWFLEPTQVSIPNGITIGSAVLQGSWSWSWHINEQTDRPRYFVCSNRPHLASAAMRPKNNRNWRWWSNPKRFKSAAAGMRVDRYTTTHWWSTLHASHKTLSTTSTISSRLFAMKLAALCRTPRAVSHSTNSTPVSV